MILSLAFAFYAFVTVAALWLVLLKLWPRCNRSRGLSVTVKVAAGVLAILLLLVRIGGVPLWKHVFSYYPNPSLPMLGLISAALCQRLFNVSVFRRADCYAIWIFGAVAGSALYLHPLMFGTVDLYYWGWERELSAWLLGALAMGFLAWGNRLGVVLLAGLLAYAVTALESRNCWDYVMDPFFWLISLGMLAVRAGVVCVFWVKRLASRVRAQDIAGAQVPELQVISRGMEQLGDH